MKCTNTAPRASSHSPLSGAFLGVFIILIGTAFLLENLGILRTRTLWHYAPSLLILYGGSKVLDSGGRPSRIIFGAVIAAGGALWLLDNFGMVRFDWQAILPMIVIAWGVALLIRALERQRILAGSGREPSSDDFTNQVAVFAGSKKSSSSQVYIGGDALAVFGGVELDLRPARMGSDRAIIEAHAVFGGVEIKVPTSWNVILQGSAVFGGFEDDTSHPNDPDAPTLIISGFAIFGGVGVKN